MLPRVRRVLADWVASGARGIGQIAIEPQGDGFALRHYQDTGPDQLKTYRSAEDAIELAKFDDAGNYRPLKTAPNLRHGWRLVLSDLSALEHALDFFYPGRLAMLAAWQSNSLITTPLRDTLSRQTGMYRVAAKISDQSIDELVGSFCCSQGGQPGCLRTILWARDSSGARPSLRLPLEKFIAPLDQTARGEKAIPLFCQEACSLLVAAAREAVKPDSRPDSDE